LCVGGRRLLPCYKNSGPFVHRNAAGNISGGWGAGVEFAAPRGGQVLKVSTATPPAWGRDIP